MAIPSIDTYLKKELSEKTKQFLSSSTDIKKHVLSEFSEDVVSSFIHTFCTDADNKGVEIPVSFTFTNVKPSSYAQILIQEKGGYEDSDPIGMDLGEGDGKDGGIVKEVSKYHYDQDKGKAYYEMQNPVYNVLSIDKYAGATEIEGKRIYQAHSMPAEIALDIEKKDEPVIITYAKLNTEASNSSKPYNLAKGFDAVETFTVDILSSNIDTLRCVTALVKASLILMKLQSMEEHYSYRLTKMNWQSMDMLAETLNGSSDSTAGNQMYSRRVEITYKPSYSLNTKGGFKIDDVNII